MHRIQNGMVGLFMFTSLEIDGKILLSAFSMSKFNLLALNSNFDHDGISEKKIESLSVYEERRFFAP